MTILNKKGVSMVETLASIVIITFVLVTILTIIINAREETNNTNHRVIAVGIANQIRDDINQNYSYTDISNILNPQQDITVDASNCSSIGLTDFCTVINQTFEGEIYNKPITITFFAPSTEAETYGFSEYTITIIYTESREIQIEGMIYE